MWRPSYPTHISLCWDRDFLNNVMKIWEAKQTSCSSSIVRWWRKLICMHCVCHSQKYSGEHVQHQVVLPCCWLVPLSFILHIAVANKRTVTHYGICTIDYSVWVWSGNWQFWVTLKVTSMAHVHHECDRTCAFQHCLCAPEKGAGWKWRMVNARENSHPSIPRLGLTAFVTPQQRQMT